MQESKVTLSVFHDGQFFSAVFEAEGGNDYRAARKVFGSRPSDNEILGLICEEYYSLEFSQAGGADVKKRLAKNPKRRQRQAARASMNTGCSTKAQAALQEQYEQNKAAANKKRCELRKISEEERYEKRRQKRKQKRRGH